MIKPPLWGTISSILGLLMVILAVLWPWLGNSESAWTEQNAEQMQQAASTLHQLAEFGGNPKNLSDAPIEKRDQYEKAHESFQRLRCKLEDAKADGSHTTKWFYGSGVALFLLGLAGRKGLTGRKGPG